MTRPRCPSRSAQLVPALYRTGILHFTVDTGCFALYIFLTGWKHAVPRIGNGRESPRCLITLGSHWVADQFEPETMAAEDPTSLTASGSLSADTLSTDRLSC